METGGFSEGSVEGIAAILTVGPYRWGAHEVVAYGVETNKVGTGAYRAPGAPQATFALEQVIDELAARLDLEPIELRRKNLVAPDDEMADGTAWAASGSTNASPDLPSIHSGTSASRSPPVRASGSRWARGPVAVSRPRRSAVSKPTAG